jgi:cell division protein FtsZ
MDLTLYELDEAANRIRSEVDPEANIIVGSTFNAELEGTMRVSVVATGIDAGEAMQPIAPNVTSLLKVTGGTAQGNQGGFRPVAAGGAPDMSGVVASGFGASIPDSAGSQPMMSGQSGEADSGSFTVGHTQAHGQDSNLARDMEPDLLAEIEDVMEESEEVAGSDANASEAPFKAPPAIKVEKRPEELINPAARESADAAASPKRKRKGPSLFERMTGVGRVSRKAEAERKEAEAASQKQERREPVAKQQSAPQPSQAQSAPQKDEALSSSVRVEPKTEDEDLLDIPAFLRRQAN